METVLDYNLNVELYNPFSKADYHYCYNPRSQFLQTWDYIHYKLKSQYLMKLRLQSVYRANGHPTVPWSCHSFISRSIFTLILQTNIEDSNKL